MYILAYARMKVNRSCAIMTSAIANIRCDNANNSARGAMSKYITQSCRQRRRHFIRFSVEN